MRLLALALLPLVFCAAAAGAQVEDGNLHPHIYKSTDGRYELFVNPTSRTGAGPSDVRLSLDGKKLWEKRFSSTFTIAAVANNGNSIGCGYSGGFYGIIPSEFVISTISNAGELRGEDRTPQSPGQFIHEGPSPIGREIILDEPNDRALINVYDPADHEIRNGWWTYQLSTGAKSKVIVPKPFANPDQCVRVEIIKRAVPETPLSLVQWWNLDLSNRWGHWLLGGRFELIDQTGKSVWKLDRPDEYTFPYEIKAEEALCDAMRASGAILRCDEPRKFTIRDVRAAKAITFEVKKDRNAPSRWSVLEVSRVDYDSPIRQNANGSAAIVHNYNARSLKHVGAITIGEPEPGLIPSKSGIVAVGRGVSSRRFILRKGPAGVFELSLADPFYGFVNAIPAPDVFDLDSAPLKMTHIADEYCFIAGPGKGENSGTAAGFINMKNGVLLQLRNLPFSGAMALELTKNRELVVLARKISNSMNSAALFKCDLEGNIKWSVPEGDLQQDTLLFSPSDAAVLSNGDIAVVEASGKDVKLYDSDGNHKRTIRLSAAWGREPAAPSAIAADENGGFAIHDAGGSPEFIHMDAAGKVIREFSPKFKDGRAVDARTMLYIDSDDSYCLAGENDLYRLNAKGVVEETPVERRSKETLRRASAVVVDRKDRIHACDEETGSIYVFDLSGHKEWICKLDPGDRKKPIFGPSIMTTDSECTYVQVSDSEVNGDIQFVMFYKSKRVGKSALAVDPIEQTSFSKPGDDGFWVVGHKKIYLLNKKWEVMHETERNVDGDWLRAVYCAHCAPDGTLAVYDGRLHLYNSDGCARASMDIPDSSYCDDFAFDGSRFVLVRNHENNNPSPRILVCDSSGKCIFEFSPPEMKTIAGAWFVKNGKELLLFDGAFTLHRYEMPALESAGGSK
ncbi:MAG: hypothetical protein HY286_07895 [Planctomycetes bacterium]|nr:hypothetical protein [Planctomycetota bacterium]